MSGNLGPKRASAQPVDRAQRSARVRPDTALGRPECPRRSSIPRYSATFSPPKRCAACGRTKTACRNISTSRRRWRARKASSASSRKTPPPRSCATARPTRSTWPSSRKRPSGSAIRCCPWSSSSSSCARARSASGRIGAPPPRTSPTPPPSCRSARRSTSSKTTSTPSPTRWPSSPRNTATRRWPAAAICSRRCRSPSATKWRLCSPPLSATSSA